MSLTFKSLCRHLVLGAVIFSSVIQAKADRFLIPGAASHDSKTSQYVRGWWPVQGQTDNVAANACYDMTVLGTHLWILANENGVASVKIINDGGIDKVDDDEKHVKYSLVREADLTGINERLKHLCRFNDKVYGLAIDGTTATIYRWDSEDSAPVKVYSASYDSTDDVKDMGSHPGNGSIYLLEDNGNTTIVRILAVGTDGKLSAEKTITLPYLGITDAYACIVPQEDDSFWIKTNNTYGSHYSADGVLIDRLSSTGLGAPNGVGQRHFVYSDRKLALTIDFCNDINNLEDHTESWNTPMITLTDYTEGTDFTNGEGKGKQTSCLQRVTDKYSVHTQSNIRTTACDYVLDGRTLTLYALDCDGGLFRIRYTMPDIALTASIKTGYNDDWTDITHFVATVSFNSLTDEQLDEINDNDVKDFNLYLIYIRDKTGKIIAEKIIDPDVIFDEDNNAILVFQPSYTFEIERGIDYKYCIGYEIEAEVLFGNYSPTDLGGIPIGTTTAQHDYPVDLGQPNVNYYIGSGANQGNRRVDIDFDAAEGGGASREPVSYYVVEYSANGTDWKAVEDMYYIVGTDMRPAGAEARIPGTYDFGQKGFAFGRQEGPEQTKAVCTYVTKHNPQNLQYRVRAVYASSNNLITKETDKTAAPIHNGTSAVMDIRNDKADVFKAYPTYATSSVTIESSDILSDNVEIYGLNGVRVMQMQGQGANVQTVDITSIPAGAYILRIGGKTAYFFKK